jgi:hypothetical protein
VHAIFDGVYHRGFCVKIFILDIILYNQNELLNSDFEFRQYYLKENWPFIKSGAPTLASGLMMEDNRDGFQAPIFELVLAQPATADIISSLYKKNPYAPIETDSLVFFRKSGKYENGLSSESVFFRDSHLSRYCIDTQVDEGYSGNGDQEMVLDVQVTGKVFLITWDKVVLKEYESVDAACRQIPKSLVKNRSRVRVSMSRDFEFTNFSVSRKPFATSFNRVVDQYRKRRQWGKSDEVDSAGDIPPIFAADPVTIEDIVTAAHV